MLLLTCPYGLVVLDVSLITKKSEFDSLCGYKMVDFKLETVRAKDSGASPSATICSSEHERADPPQEELVQVFRNRARNALVRVSSNG